MTSKRFNTRATGFSLIEVLVAVVILSIGLLALASLQLSMIRSSSATKAQTIAAALAKERIEQIRAFRSLDAYRQWTTPAAGTVESINDDGTGNLGGLQFTRTTKIKRYVYDKAATVAKFVELTTAQNTLTDTAISALNNVDGVTSPQYVLTKDFKRIAVDVTWTGSMNEPLRVSMEDILDSLDPTESASILGLVGASSGARKIEEKISDPALDAMVIPIAVGGGSESAASNPKPVVTTGHDTVETRFDVFTYNAVSGGTANAQQKVETSVVSCSCSTASPLPGSSVRGYRPTYWDGSRYAIPSLVDTSGAGSYSPKAKADPAYVNKQSSLCTACCRDHYDQNGVKGAAFSPKLATKDVDDMITATTHNHYLANSSGTAWTALTSGGSYSEACRVIRVEGFWRVAADLNNDYFNLLATKDLSNAAYYASASTPDSTATTNYQGFVVDYLDARFTNNATPSTYNVDSTTYNASSPIVALATSHSLATPSSVTLPTNFTGVVSTKTITAITQANPAVATSTAHGFANGDRVTITGAGGMTALNGNSFIISGVTANTFALVGVNSSAYPAFTGSATAVVNHGKWLHSRGLFVDYLEKTALDAVANAKAACPSQTGSAYSDCVLRVLPFTSINLTEIADWASADINKASVTTNDYSDSSTKPDPVRGKVTYVGGANGSTVVVSSKARKSNTGLLDLTTNAISSNDNAQWDTTPSQTFQISNSVVVPPPTADTFYAMLNLSPKTGLGVNYKIGVAASQPCSGFNNSQSNYPCQVLPSNTLPTSIGVEVVGYNSVTPDANATTIPDGTTCTGVGNATGFTALSFTAASAFGGAKNYVRNTCNIYPTPTASNTTTGALPTSTTPSNASTQSAKTLFNFALITGDANTADTSYVDMVSINFGAPTSTPQPMACTFDCTKVTGGKCKSNAETTIYATSTCP
jgi:type IV pilus modification protein PilV